MELTTRKLLGEDTAYLELEFADGRTHIPIRLGKLEPYDGPIPPTLGRMGGSKGRQGRPPNPRSQREAAEEFLHEFGVYHPENLVQRLGHEGFNATLSDLEALENEEDGVLGAGGLLISTRSDSQAAQAIRALLRLGVDDQEEITSGLRRLLQGRSAVPTVDRRAAAEAYVDTTRSHWEGWPPPTAAEDIHAHLTLVRHMRSQEGGVLTVGEVEAYVRNQLGWSVGANPIGNSPLLERVANGLVGVRGAPIALGPIELKRDKTWGGWAPWGRLDRDRVWAEVKSKGAELKVRLTNDCLELLGTEPYPLVSAAGTPMGILKLVADGRTNRVQIEWVHDVPEDWIPEEHTAVLEFKVRPERSVRLFAGSTTGEVGDPRFTDGCVLVRGRWGAVGEIDQGVLDGAGFSIPLAVGGLGDMDVGSTVTLEMNRVGGECVHVEREPHRLRLHGLEKAFPELQVGDFAVVHGGEGLCEAEVAPATTDPTERLLRSVGLFAEPRMFWSAIGSTLGGGNSVRNRQQVRMALADRLRLDLVALTYQAHEPMSSNRGTVDPDGFEIVDGHLSQDRGNERVFADGTAGSGQFGLRWTSNRRELSHPDPRWADMTLLLLRVWSAASPEEVITIERREGGWETSLESELHETLLKALKAIARESKPLTPSQYSGCFPTAYIAYILALEHAEKRIEKLEVSESGWWSTDSSDNVRGPTPIAALSGD